MRRTGLVLLALVALLAVTFAPVAAVTDGEKDGNGHPYVGMMVAQTIVRTVVDVETGETADVLQPLWRCSGTLMAPGLYLTAGHCAEAPASHAEIWFAAGPITTDPNYVSVAAGGTGCANPEVTGYPCHGEVGGTPITHPDYNPYAFYLYDLGVVVLDEPKVMSAYGALPQLDQLDALKTKRGQQDVTFTAVGYGLQKSFPDAAA